MHISVLKFLMGVFIGMILIAASPQIYNFFLDSFAAIGNSRVNVIFSVNDPMEKIK